MTASRIAAKPDHVAQLLEDEERQGRVSRQGDRWALRVEAFPADVAIVLRDQPVKRSSRSPSLPYVM
jgi:hypothetical protein